MEPGRNAFLGKNDEDDNDSDDNDGVDGNNINNNNYQPTNFNLQLIQQSTNLTTTNLIQPYPTTTISVYPDPITTFPLIFYSNPPQNHQHFNP